LDSRLRANDKTAAYIPAERMFRNGLNIRSQV
jgi:hypothetical protein